MGQPVDFKLTVYEGEDWAFKAYVTNEDGVAITKADLKGTAGDDGMDVFCYDEDIDPSATVYSETDIDVGSAGGGWAANIIVDTAITTGWSKSPPGWNLDWTLTNAELETQLTTGAVGGHRYRVEIHLNRVASVGGDIVLRGYVDVLPMASM